MQLRFSYSFSEPSHHLRRDVGREELVRLDGQRCRELSGASHFEPVGNAGDFRGPSTAWFRYHLMDDASAESTFYGSNCDLCTDNDWDVRRKGIN